MNLTLTCESHVDYNCFMNSITQQQLENYESVVSDHTTRPSVVHDKYDTEKLYNFIVFDTETNTTGKKAELCQLPATDKYGVDKFSCYIFPNRNIDKQVSRVNKLTIKSVNGIVNCSKKIDLLGKFLCMKPLHSSQINWSELSTRHQHLQRKTNLCAQYSLVTMQRRLTHQYCCEMAVTISQKI